jgi:hypothetical protein
MGRGPHPRSQKEVARFARDILRIKGEVIAEHFSAETLAKMSGVELPTAADKAQAQAAAGAGAAMAQQTGACAAARGVLQSPTWEDVDGAASRQRQARPSGSTSKPIPRSSRTNRRRRRRRSSCWGHQQHGLHLGPGAGARSPMLAPMVAAFIKWGVRRFRAGRELETVIDQAMDQIGAGGMQPPQAPGQGAPAQPPPDQTPLLVAQTNLQREQVHQSGEIQRAQIQAQVQAGDQQLHAGDQRLKMLIGGRDQTPQVAV